SSRRRAQPRQLPSFPPRRSSDLPEAVGGLSGWLTREGAKLYGSTIAQPPLSPPGAAFPIVWAALFALMGISAARVYLAPPSLVRDRKSTRLNSSHVSISYAVFCL